MNLPASPEWVELTKTNGEIDARLVAGNLESEGIETHLEKAPGVWRYGASDPFALVTVYVHEDDVERAERLLRESSPEAYEFDKSESHDDVELVDPFIRSRPLRWWIAAFIAGGLILALMRSTVSEVLF